jgi:hypothetical protein
MTIDKKSNVTLANASDKKRMWDGCSEKELLKAMSTFLNVTSPGDYQLPKLTGNNKQTIMSDKKNSPCFTMRSKFDKYGYFPNMACMFQG